MNKKNRCGVDFSDAAVPEKLFINFFWPNMAWNVFLYLSTIETKQITWTKLWTVSSRNSWGRRIHKQKETLKELWGRMYPMLIWNQFRDKSSVMLVGSCIPATSYQVLLSEIGNFVVLAIWLRRRVIMFGCKGHLHTNVANNEAEATEKCL